MRLDGTIKEIGNKIYELYKEGKFNKEKNYQCEIKQHKENKTERQRSYYWATLREYALACREPQEVIHNKILGNLGYVLTRTRIIKGEEKVIFEKVYRPPEYNYLKSNIHLKPTGKKNEDGYLEYYVLQNSENFTTQQYSELIDFLHNEIIDTGYDDRININFSINEILGRE